MDTQKRIQSSTAHCNTYLHNHTYSSLTSSQVCRAKVRVYQVCLKTWSWFPCRGTESAWKQLHPDSVNCVRHHRVQTRRCTAVVFDQPSPLNQTRLHMVDAEVGKPATWSLLASLTAKTTFMLILQCARMCSTPVQKHSELQRKQVVQTNPMHIVTYCIGLCTTRAGVPGHRATLPM